MGPSSLPSGALRSMLEHVKKDMRWASCPVREQTGGEHPGELFSSFVLGCEAGLGPESVRMAGRVFPPQSGELLASQDEALVLAAVLDGENVAAQTGPRFLLQALEANQAREDAICPLWTRASTKSLGLQA